MLVMGERPLEPRNEPSMASSLVFMCGLLCSGLEVPFGLLPRSCHRILCVVMRHVALTDTSTLV